VSGDPYLYPGTNVLRNRLGLRDPKQFDAMERQLVTQRLAEHVPLGSFDLAHLCAIHRHLFQDIYEWAGEVRTVEISKGGHQFQFRRYISTGMADIHSRILKANGFRGLDADGFCAGAAHVLGDLNYVHPFREGNGRTQILYLKQLAQQAGHPIVVTRLAPDFWLQASRHAHLGDYSAMSRAIRSTISA
jgi:cell filamentation protein